MQKGEVLPSMPRFDSNCITPGTDFMARLHEHLKYFVNKKLSSDPTWQKVEIILSVRTLHKYTHTCTQSHTHNKHALQCVKYNILHLYTLTGRVYV